MFILIIILLNRNPKCKMKDFDKKQYCLCNPEYFPIISVFRSIHNNKNEDQQWSLECGVLKGGVLGKEIDTGHEGVNQFDKDMNWEGWKMNKFLTGLESRHSNRKEDRKYYVFWAKSKSAWTISGCSEWNQVNKADENINLVIPEGKVIGGLRSHHDNDAEDRIFKLKICDLKCEADGYPCNSQTDTSTKKTIKSSSKSKLSKHQLNFNLQHLQLLQL